MKNRVMKKWLMMFCLAGGIVLFGCENDRLEEDGFTRSEEVEGLEQEEDFATEEEYAEEGYGIEQEESEFAEGDTAAIIDEGNELDTEQDVQGF